MSHTEAREASESSPKPRVDPRLASALLLCAVVATLAAVDAAVRFGIGRISRIEGRTEKEWTEALAIGSRQGASKQVLLIGNSLLLEGVDYPALQRELSPEFIVRRYVVESTQYLDWRYGLAHLYSRGARPDVVVLSIGGNQLPVNQIRDGYFAYRLMDTSDFLEAFRAAELSGTETFSLLVANLSVFYGTRSETRKVLLARMAPFVKNLQPFFVPAPEHTQPDRSRLIDVCAQRLKALDELARAHGSRFIFLEPATVKADEESYIREAAKRAEVPALVPLPAAALSATDFSDGYHLNPSGASRYTTALAPALRGTMKALIEGN